MPDYLDFVNFMKAQKAYIKDMANFPGGANVSNIDAAETALDGVSKQLGTANTSDFLVDTAKINSILTSESNILEEKADAANKSNHLQKRLVNINNSYNKRYQAFNKITYAVILATLLIIALIYERKLVGFLPEFIQTLLYIAIISIAGIYIMFVLVSINSRQELYFDKIKTSPPNRELERSSDDDLKNQSGELNLSTCKGISCCPTKHEDMKEVENVNTTDPNNPTTTYVADKTYTAFDPSSGTCQIYNTTADGGYSAIN